MSIPYDERTRDPQTTSSIRSEPMTEERLSQVFLETLRQFFLNPLNFQSRIMREREPALTWDPDPAEEKVRIVRDIDWLEKSMGNTPEVVVRSQGTQWQTYTRDGKMTHPHSPVEGAEWITHHITARLSIWSISHVPSEARNISWEIATFLAAFARPLANEYCLILIAPAASGGTVKIEERKGYWGSPVSVGCEWFLTQSLTEQAPRLAEIHMNTES